MMTLKSSPLFYLKKLSEHLGVEKLVKTLDMNVDEIKSIVKCRKLRTEDIKKIHSMYEVGKSIKKLLHKLA